MYYSQSLHIKKNEEFNRSLHNPRERDHPYNLTLLLKSTSQQPHPRLYVWSFNTREVV